MWEPPLGPGDGRGRPRGEQEVALLLPVLGGLLTVLVVLDGSVAAAAGVAFGVGVVLLAGALSWRENRATAE